MNRRWIIFIIIGSLLLLGLCVGAGYFVWATLIGSPPGVGTKAEEGYKACAPIIEALERYKSEHGAYPETLEALVPIFLSELSTETENTDIDYQATGSSYKLVFRYAGPGMNICTYTPETGWDCEGYY